MLHDCVLGGVLVESHNFKELPFTAPKSETCIHNICECPTITFDMFPDSPFSILRCNSTTKVGSGDSTSTVCFTPLIPVQVLQNCYL